MAVTSATSSISYTGNASTVTSYAVPFLFLENSHLSAIAKVTATGAESVVTLTNHTGAGDISGGTVRTAVAVPATSTLTISRTVPATQTTSYAEGGDFPAASHERALDKLTMLGQQIARSISRTVRLSDAAPETSPLPVLPNRFFGTDDTGAIALVTGTDAPAGTLTDANIASDAAIALSKLATGALPAAITVASANIVNGTIVNADISDTAAIVATKLASDSITNTQIKSDAAIAGTKIAPNFGSQDARTTGQAAVGTAIIANVKLNVGGTMPAQTTQRALAVAPAFDNNASAEAQAVITGPSTSANGGSAYTVPSLTHFFANQGTLHADSTVTNQYGLLVSSTLDDATNNFGVVSQIPASGAANWNVYASGTAPNYFGGPLRVGTTANFTTDTGTTDGLNYNTTNGILYLSNALQGSLSIRRRGDTGAVATFVTTNNDLVGSISVTANATSYNQSSDYRLKDDPTLMTGALGTIAALNPVEFTWKSDGSVGRGFIAHELQAVVPEAVTGAKDAVDNDGNPSYQGVDASKIVPFLVAAVKELSARVEQLEALQP